MATNLVSKRNYGSKILDLPASWSSGAEVNHATNDRDTEEVHELEVSKDFVKTNSEALLFEFFGGGGPFHLDGEEMAKQSSGQMERNPTKEEDEHGCPFDSFDDGPEEYLLAETVTQHRECER